MATKINNTTSLATNKPQILGFPAEKKSAQKVFEENTTEIIFNVLSMQNEATSLK